MSKAIAALALLTAVTLGHPSAAHAQGRSTASAADLAGAVASTPDADRAELERFLGNDAVVAAAQRMGISQAELAERAGRLDAAGLSQLAPQARDVNRDLAGGSETIVISATTVNIVLLILILLTN